MSLPIRRVLSCLALASTLATAQAPTTSSPPSGDARRIAWVKGYEAAIARAKATGRPILCKPILGGSNEPAPGGVPCGGKNDCEGSW